MTLVGEMIFLALISSGCALVTDLEFCFESAVYGRSEFNKYQWYITSGLGILP